MVRSFESLQYVPQETKGEPVRIGELLYAWRTHRDLTLAEMGARLEIPVPTLQALEKGRLPDGKTMVKIFAWLFAPVEAKGRITE